MTTIRHRLQLAMSDIPLERAEFKDVRRDVQTILDAHAIRFAPAIERYLYAPDPVTRDDRVLDAGCGAGQGALVLQSKGYRRIAAVDRDPAAADLLRAEGVAFRCAPLEEFTPQSPFDLVCCCDVLEHLDDPEMVLARIAKWLRPYGLVYVTVPLEGAVSPNCHHRHSWTRGAFERLFTKRFQILSAWTWTDDWPELAVHYVVGRGKVT